MKPKREDILFELTKIAGVDRCIVTINNLETTLEIAQQIAALVKETRSWQAERKKCRLPVPSVGGVLSQ